MSTGSNERRRARPTLCAGCGVVRPKRARWRWCWHCPKPTPWCSSCAPGHAHQLEVKVQALVVDKGPAGQLRGFALEAEGGPELVRAVAELLGPAATTIGSTIPAPLALTPPGAVVPDLILPRGFDRLGETVNGGDQHARDREDERRRRR